MVDVRVTSHTALGLLTVFLIHHYWRRWSRAQSPPSPMSLPFVGNLFSIPPDKEHLAFATLGEQLKSDIVFLKIFGQKILVLNSAEAASDLLDKRSALYSDRDVPAMIRDPTLMNWSMGVGAVKYNELLRQYRRMMNNWLSMRVVAQFHGLQEKHSRLLLKRLLNATKYAQPFKSVKEEIFYATASLIFEIAYGYKLKSPQDPFFKESTQAYHNLTVATMHTNFLVNIFPMMSYIPDWFPGTGWKRTARKWRTQQEKAKNEPYEWLKFQVAKGTHQASLLSALIQDHEILSGMAPADKDERLQEIGSVLFGGGTDTVKNSSVIITTISYIAFFKTSCLFVCFIAAMVLNPHVQARAQQELDTILGPATLPSISDIGRLPYTRNLIEELWRLYPPFPLGKLG
ncbi:unnamed protein product [Rhizoctonia solani]|uniref:O-methylsterigmatocystin oxidoreductase n=1 Tax=Rhizoctonia solani TaxID=456999 RepID=A0A8H3CA12_9AGAM|nr:unnamed protein product [Rhizoctonia solani]